MKASASSRDLSGSLSPDMAIVTRAKVSDSEHGVKLKRLHGLCCTRGAGFLYFTEAFAKPLDNRLRVVAVTFPSGREESNLGTSTKIYK